MTKLDILKEFIKESNKIEGIIRDPLESEIEAHTELLDLRKLTIAELDKFVHAIGGGPLRNSIGMNVHVGDHHPIPGGPIIVQKLSRILNSIETNNGPPWLLHCEYESLHPFMDGNGRSGRALWAWQILRHRIWPKSLIMGFLHPTYYAALDASQGRK